jgi:hypothetical protein
MDASCAFNGQEANQGELAIGTLYPDEGFAVLRCGNTSVKIGYTLLRNLQIEIDKDSARFSELAQLQKAVYSIACEASLGHRG